MNRRRLGKTTQRILAFVLTITLVLGGMPITAKADNVDSNGKVTDPSTIHSWENYFKDETTEFAGSVWTDKSVFKNADEFETSLGNTAMDIKMKSEDNFLVALSALASNKEIVGYSTIPTDTVFILDVSQSMDNSGSIPQMVSSANEAIKDLLELNLNNRVGVVLYSGNSNSGSSQTSTGTKLLELNRYTANRQGNYLTYSGSDDTTVSIASGLKFEGGSNVSTRSKNTAGGTYIQNGLSLASDVFEAADDKVIGSGNVQSGTKRMPIIVLMSDGAPTTGTASYTNIQTSTVGNGTTTSAGLGFMTQLTAAHVKSQVETWYGGEAKFYTLGLNLSGTDNESYIANSVLNPENSLNAIDTYWDNLFNSGSASFFSPGTRANNNQDIWVTVSRNAQDGMKRESQNYVTEHFAASGTTGLEAAFSSIVNEIILQSAYYPTLIGGDNTNLDGYITFEDEIGQFMEVKNITGLMLGDNQLFTGAALTKMMGSSEFGDRNTYTELGWELVESVAERIGVSQEVAIEILKQAWADGQLSYTDDNNFSNYIGWYESADGKYVAYWNEDHTAADQPESAKYITRSYGFYGTANVGAIESLGSDMMHIVIKVRTEITTQHQDVVFMIPASLIPVITYHVELNSDDYATATEFKMYTDEQKPIRLLFEVGLRSDINELNITEKLAAENLVAGQHIHRNTDGTYTFYTNQWGSGNENQDIDYSNPSAHLVTESHFHPNVANERYYYITDTIIYEKTGTDSYKEYTGATKPSGNNFYHTFRVFNQTNATTQAAEMVDQYIPISNKVLDEHAKAATDGSNTWYIEKGTIYQNLDRFREEITKSANNTGTLRYFDYPVVAHPDNNTDTYDIWSYLGNNGRLTVTPATGIKLTKLVDDTVTDANATFKFTVELSGRNYDGTYRFVNADGTYGTITFSNGKSSVIELKANETVYIIDLPVGANYTVTETNENTSYKVDSVSQNGTKLTGVTATGTIVSMEIVDVEFTNTARQYGDLIISKTVTHDFGTDYTIPADKKFDVEVTLGLANGTQVETSVGTKTVANGKIMFQLAHDESVTILNLLEGTTYSVAEVNVPTGFTLTTPVAERQGTIDNSGAEVDLINDYNPTGFAPAADINVNVTKTLKDVNGQDVSWGAREYKFYLEKLVGTTWEKVTTTAAVANGTDSTFTVKIPEASLREVGRYLFRVHEDEGNLEEGIVSDTAVYFVVVVTDKDMDGSLEVDQILVNNAPIADKENVNLTFTNTYVVTEGLVVHVPVKKTLDNNTGVNLLPSGFEFGLYEGNTLVSEIATTNANGDATVYLSYTSAWFNEQTKNPAGNVEKTYTLKEIGGGKKENGMSYTDKAYTVKVEIGINGNALELVGFSIDGVTTGEAAPFTNTYRLDPAPLSISGTKTLTGREIGNDKYEFRMYETGSDFDVSKAVKVLPAVENSGNAFTLTDSVETAGVHYYVIEEVQGDVPGVTYDTTRYHVTVIVKDNNAGGLAIANSDISIVKVGTGAVNAVEFTNEYKTTPTSIEISGRKVLTGKALEHNMFEFVLKEGTKEVSKAWSSANGTIVFPTIEYTTAGTHKYTVTEVNAGKMGYTYDDSSFEVTVEVTDNLVGQLTASITEIKEIDGADRENVVDSTIVFRNEYTPNPVSISLEAVKLLENRHLINREFTFQLFETQSDFGINSSAIETAHNRADGKIVFTHEITEAGTYYFVIKEDASNPKVDIVYDNTEYQLTVIVYDVGGELAYHVSYAVDGRPVEYLVFSNVFVPQDPVQKEVHVKGKTDINIDGEAVIPGDVLTYEIDYTNLTNVEQDDLVIADTIPAGTTYVEGSASEEGFVSHVNGVLTWKFDDVAAGEKVVVTFDVKVNEGKATITNQAHVELGTNSWNTNEVTNYTFDKEVDKTEVKIGEEVTYTILYKNTESEAVDVIIVDKLVEGLTYVEGSATNGGVYNKETHTITWNLDDVAALADGEVSFKVIVNEKAVEVIDNVATIQIGNDAAVTVETDTVETKVLVPELEISKKQALNSEEATTAVLQAKKGDKVTYYLTVKNTGNLAATGIKFTDKVPEGLTVDEKSISDKGVLKDGTITWAIDELKADESITVSFTVTVTEENKNARFTNVAQTVYENDPIAPDEAQKTNEVIFEYVVESSPKTGDGSSIGIWSGLVFSSLMACSVLLIMEKRRRNEA